MESGDLTAATSEAATAGAAGSEVESPEGAGGAFGFVAKFILVATPFLLAAILLFLDWWLR